MYLVDYGKTVRFSPNTYQLKELDTDTQDIPFFAVECALKGWLDDPQIYRQKLFKFLHRQPFSAHSTAKNGIS